MSTQKNMWAPTSLALSSALLASTLTSMRLGLQVEAMRLPVCAQDPQWQGNLPLPHVTYTPYVPVINVEYILRPVVGYLKP